MTFTEKLIQASRTNNSLLCVGLDVDLDRVPPFLLAEKDVVGAFNRAVIEATADLVCAYKPNMAFYEALGEKGWRALHKIRQCVPEEIPIIADAKRGDIGNTARMYAKAFFEDMGFDAITLNPYMGFDAVEPFLKFGDKCAFVLCLTSNPSADDFQRFSQSQRPLFLEVARKVVAWSQHGSCGLVVGATQAGDLKQVREMAPQLPILIPGVGAQGGDLATAVRDGVNGSGELAVINVARSILYASAGRDFAQRARQEAMRLRDEINRHRGG
jgi:orotidine-5'-phosphate decarboxylase